MIGRLTGRVLSCGPDRVLLDVAGVGYDVRIPLSTFYTLSSRPPGAVSLHVHTHVREDALQLFGFASLEERTLFEKLITISGVGPRLALAILSGIGADELRSAVARRDRARMERIPGVGKKTAERVLLELRDKLELDLADAGAARGADGRGAGGDHEGHPAALDAVSALVNLGYSRDVARRAVRAGVTAAGPDAGLEQLLRAALAGLVR